MSKFGAFNDVVLPAIRGHFIGQRLKVRGGIVQLDKFKDNGNYLMIEGRRVDSRDKMTRKVYVKVPKGAFDGHGFLSDGRETSGRKYREMNVREAEPILVAMFNDGVTYAFGKGKERNYRWDYVAEEAAAAPVESVELDESESEEEPSGAAEEPAAPAVSDPDKMKEEDDASTEPDRGYQSQPEHKSKKSKKQKMKVSKKKLRQLYQNAHVQQGNMGVQLTNPVFDQSSKHLKLVGQIYDIADDGTFSYSDKLEIIGETSDLNPADPEYVDKVRELTKKIIAKYRERKLSNPATEAEKRGAQLSRRIPVASRRAIMKKIREFKA